MTGSRTRATAAGGRSPRTDEAALNAVMTRRELQEQLWLSRDLHDSVAHALTAIHVHPQSRCAA